MHMQFKGHRYRNNQFINSSKPEPDASIVTVDSLPKNNLIRPLLIDRDSGSACCVPIQWKDDGKAKYTSDGTINRANKEERRLLLGFSHRKTRRGARAAITIM